MKALTLFIFILTSQAAVAASPISLTERLLVRNELLLTTREVKDFLFHPDIKNRLAQWYANLSDSNYDNPQTYAYECKFYLRPYFPAENILDPLCYVLRQNDPALRSLYKPLVKRALLEIKAALLEIIDDPNYAELEKSTGNLYQGKAVMGYFNLNEKNISAITNCFKSAEKIQYDVPNSSYVLPFKEVASCLGKFKKIGPDNDDFLPLNLVKDYSYQKNENEIFPIQHPGHALSETGWIGGNKLTYFNYNDWNLSREELAGRLKNLYDNYVLDQDKDQLQYFLKKPVSEVFADPAFDFETHPVWSQPKGIFAEIKKELNRAQKTIFMDVFFFGGSMGAALAKKLVALLEERPELKVFILKDTHNFFAYRKEMMPIFNFLLSYSIRNPGRLVIGSSYVDDHISGLPPFLAHLVAKDKLTVDTGIRDHLLKLSTKKIGLYAAAKSDHSKVIVIDGKGKNPVAFVGSKNLTDSSGAICYDDTVKIEGPLATVVQDDYYYDLFFSLRYEMEGFYKGYSQKLAKEGWSKAQYREGMSMEEMITLILRPVDLLDRDAKHRAHLSKDLEVTEQAENTLARTGYNNVDSTRTSVLDQVIQMINFAKKNIYIQEQFVFDRKVVDALVAAKARNKNLDVKIILEPINEAKIKGFPNIVYLDVLKDAGIEVHRKITKPAFGISQEFHHKTTSADGKYLIVGSANKDQITMYGAFREQQLHIASAAVAKAHDQTFLERWNSPEESEDFPLFDFVLDSKGLTGKDLSEKEFIQLLRNLVLALFEAKES